MANEKWVYYLGLQNDIFRMLDMGSQVSLVGSVVYYTYPEKSGRDAVMYSRRKYSKQYNLLYNKVQDADQNILICREYSNSAGIVRRYSSGVSRRDYITEDYLTIRRKIIDDLNKGNWPMFDLKVKRSIIT